MRSPPDLRADIMTGTLRPGTFIRLDETAAALGVSITPVREALRTLRGEGMVQLEPHRGHVVVPLTRGDIEDIFWLQATIAKELAATAAERITDVEIDELERLNEGLATAVGRGDPEDIVAAEFVFHRALNRVDRPDQAGLVPVACRALSAGADLRQRRGVGNFGGRHPPRGHRSVAPPRRRHRRPAHQR